MAKRTTDTAEASPAATEAAPLPAAEPAATDAAEVTVSDGFTPAERREYVLKVIAKQTGLSADQAAKIVEQLGADELTLFDAGREGRIADVRKLLGL